MSERDEFEAWANRRFDVERYLDSYNSTRAAAAWEGWQAARATPPQAVPALTDEPEYWQWRRKGQPWSLERTFVSQVHATTDDTEVRPLYAAPAPAALTDILQKMVGAKLEDALGPHHLALCLKQMAHEALDLLAAAPQPSQEPEKAERQKLPSGGGQSFKSVNEAHEKAAYPKYQD